MQYERVAKEASKEAKGISNLVEASGSDEWTEWHKVMKALSKAGEKRGKHDYDL